MARYVVPQPSSLAEQMEARPKLRFPTNRSHLVPTKTDVGYGQPGGGGVASSFPWLISELTRSPEASGYPFELFAEEQYSELPEVLDHPEPWTLATGARAGARTFSGSFCPRGDLVGPQSEDGFIIGHATSDVVQEPHRVCAQRSGSGSA